MMVLPAYAKGLGDKTDEELIALYQEIQSILMAHYNTMTQQDRENM